MAEERRRETVAAGAVLLGLVLLHFRDAVFGGQAFFHRDVHLMWYTQIETLVRSVARGQWPLWNPYLGFGQPLWADGNVQVLYPTTWLHLALRPWTVYTVYVLLHFLLAGCGFFRLARRLGAGAPAATVGAAAWILSGPLLSMTEIWNQLGGVAWMPWAALAALATVTSGRPAAAAAWGACHAAQVLAGSPEALVLTVGGLVAYAAVERPWRAAGVRTGRVLALTVLAAAFALGLSAGQWLPSAEAASRSTRLSLPFEARFQWSVHPVVFAQTLLPVPLHRLTLRPEWAQALLDGRPPLYPSLYLGAALTLLAATGLASGTRRTQGLFLGGLAAAVIIALGRHTPLFALVDAPGPLGALRYPVKAMPVVALLWAALVTRGVDAFGAARRRWPPLAAVAAVAVANGALFVVLATDEGRAAPILADTGVPLDVILAPALWRLGLAAGTAAVVASAAWRFRSPGFGNAGFRPVILASLGVMELLAVHDGLSPTAPRALYSIRPAALEQARPTEEGRLYAYDYLVPGAARRHLRREVPYAIVRAPLGWDVPAATALAMRLSLHPPSAGAFGAAGSFDRDVPGLAPRELAHFADLIVAAEGTPAHLRLLQVGAVSRVAALHGEGLEALRLLGTAESLLAEPLRIFEVPDPRPRAYAVGEARVVPAEETLRVLLDPTFDPATEVLLTTPAMVSGRGAGVGTAGVVEVGSDHIVVESRLEAPGLVVLVESYDPGWRAYTSGVERPVLRANGAFMAVALGAGPARITFRYRPRAVFLGLAVSAVTLLAGGAVLSSRRPQ